MTVQFRTTLFHSRYERKMEFTHGEPRKLWNTFCEMLPRLWSEADLVLPTLTECRTQLDHIFQAEAAGTRQPSRKTASRSSRDPDGSGRGTRPRRS